MKSINPRRHLAAFVSLHKTQTAAAVALGVSPSYLSDLLSGRRAVTLALMARLGLKQIVVNK